MSGLAAVLSFDGTPADESVRRMLRAAPYRGSRYHIEVAGPCALGVSSTGVSGLATCAVDGPWAGALVGNLDNHGVLAAEVAGAGLDDGGGLSSPAATVIAACRRWGPGSAVRRFRGAFAGVVWDGESLWCFRDHVGFQPLFYRTDGRACYVAGEAKQVAVGAGLSIEPDIEALEVLFYRGIGQNTAIKGVRRFLSSALARVDRQGRVSIERYWDPAPLVESARLRLPEACEQLVALLHQAVGRVVTGRDVVTLSGGLDSPTVAAFAAPAHLQAGGRPLQALTTSYPEFPSVEEGSYARRVAEYLGIPIRTHVLSGSPLEDVDVWTKLADGPWDTLPMPIVLQTYRLARELGARTVLTGELAEYVYTLTPSLLGHMLWHGRLRPLVRYARALIDQGRSRASVARRVAREAMPSMLGRAYVRLRNRRNRLLPDWIDVTAVGGSPFRQEFSDPPQLRWRKAQLSATRGTTSTLEADEIASASCGVRVRRPLADVDLWEFFLSLRAEVKFPDPIPKSILRRAMRGRLPDEILDRRGKTVFDEYALGTADFAALERWIDPSQFRMRGVNYDRLRSILARRRLSVGDLMWAYDLAKIHAFVAGFDRVGGYPSFGVYTDGRPA